MAWEVEVLDFSNGEIDCGTSKLFPDLHDALEYAGQKLIQGETVRMEERQHRNSEVAS